MKLLSIFILLLSFQVFALEKATFAGGCFWCMEQPFEEIRGVKSVISGFSGGNIKNPSYKQVSSGKTKHIEVVQVTYDPELVSYNQLLNTFWVNIDPTDDGGQFVDRGYQYSTGIFFHSEEQRKLAKKSKEYISSLKIENKKIVTPIIKFKSFYPAEEYHQDFYKKSIVTKLKYKYYRNASGRDKFLDRFWKGISLKFGQKDKLSALTKLQYEVTQNDGTEPPFRNKYWDNKKEGIYVDIVSKEPLFSSLEKFKSGTGWPSFYKPLEEKNIVQKEDRSLFSTRVEVRSKGANSHLGHVFKDGPKPTGLRYCINSASLEFIPKDELVARGYAKYVKIFM